MSDSENGTTVNVTSKGQATIPKEFRDKLHIDTPGRVRFVEADGEIVVKPVKRPSEIRGALAAEETDGETSATKMLLKARKRDSDG
ncbi:AbrB/MazE/SpoVT family DNA-binding domain-containing protein [Halorubrum sp. AJ67]|uniref:AbrB/MazE/SpoVT family DNA-binding domain-containing protein n=1 Tax=Halorubrum sp. AJ67 TaxID=1173487 RepID=UPI00064EE86C|nr:AbrB/MazE/SpoVT family DNA-binding domain-containing protein [Halorubrum sp. AJ67]